MQKNGTALQLLFCQQADRQSLEKLINEETVKKYTKES